MSRTGRVFERVFLVECSGPTLALLRAQAARLPHIGGMLATGASAAIRGPLPSAAPLAYATLLTGRNPGKTGIFDFFQMPAGGYRRIPYSLERLAVEPLFRTLSDHGLQVGLLNTLLSHPLPDVNGFVVSGDEGIGDDFAFPADVRARLNEAGYVVPFGASYAPGREREFQAHAMERLRMRRAALRSLFAEGPWTFGMLTLHEIGEVLHAFWRFHDARHPAYRPAPEVFECDPVEEALVALDQVVGDVIELAGPRGLVLLAGGWGHRLVHSRVQLNAVLENAGLLRFRRSARAQFKRLVARSGFSFAAAERLAHRLNIWKLLHYGIPRGRRAALSGAAFLSFADIDWRRTRAVAAGYLGQIHLNVRGVRPLGVIPPQDYQAERRQVANALESLRDPRTGGAVVERAIAREELYTGPQLENAPDLVLQLAEGWSASDAMGGRGQPFEGSPPGYSSEHSPESALVASGAGIPAGSLGTVRLEDIAPTILRALGVPVPEDYDGAPLPIFAGS